MSRLIDADALLEVLESTRYGHIQRLKDLITNAPTVQREGWVSVKDRFPERIEGMKILCFGNGYIFEAECEDGQWCNLGGDDFTHWQPLPAAPKE